MFETVMFETVMVEAAMFEAVMFEAVMFEAVMFQTVMFETVMFETVMFENCRLWSSDSGFRIPESRFMSFIVPRSCIAKNFLRNHICIRSTRQET